MDGWASEISLKHPQITYDQLSISNRSVASSLLSWTSLDMLMCRVISEGQEEVGVGNIAAKSLRRDVPLFV